MTADRSAGAPPAVAGAPRPRFGSVTIRHRGYLPHWESESAAYFVTFRLADSLPQPVLARFLFERNDIVTTARQLSRELTEAERKKLGILFSRRIERFLDASTGACILRHPSAAQTVRDCLLNRDDVEYRLIAWCVMPNHVHTVVKPFPSFPLSAIVQAWKSVTAHRINKLMGRKGALWGREYFDRLIRNEGELDQAVAYVTANPVRAGLRDWKWVGMCGRGARTTAGEAPALR